MNIAALKGYKTLIFNAASAALYLATMLTGTVTDPTQLKILGIVVVVANAALRFVTTSPVFNKGGAA